jgi:hypothetical protein
MATEDRGLVAVRSPNYYCKTKSANGGQRLPAQMEQLDMPV